MLVMVGAFYYGWINDRLGLAGRQPVFCDSGYIVISFHNCFSLSALVFLAGVNNLVILFVSCEGSSLWRAGAVSEYWLLL